MGIAISSFVDLENRVKSLLADKIERFIYYIILYYISLKEGVYWKNE